MNYRSTKGQRNFSRYESSCSSGVINTSFSQFSSFVRPSATSSVPSIRTAHCFCPPSYYGDRCQLYRRRMTLLLHFDQWIRQEIPWSIDVLVTLVHNKKRIVDHQFFLDIVRDQSYKHHLYLLYPRSRLAGSHSIRIEAYHSVALLSLGDYSLGPFEFLPVFRLAKVLRFPSVLRPLQCRENHCRNNGTCYRTPSEHSICLCLCLPERHGQLCEKQSRPSRCVANSLVRDENICIYPRGYLLPNCFVQNRRCEQPMSCSANQRCSPIPRQPPNGFLCSPNRSEGHPCHSQRIIERNESNSSALLLQLLKTFDDYFLIRQQILLSPKTNFPLRIPFRASHLFDKTNLSSFIALIWIFHPFRNSISRTVHLVELKCLKATDDLPLDRCELFEQSHFSSVKEVPTFCEQSSSDQSCFLWNHYLCFCNSSTFGQSSCLSYDQRSTSCSHGHNGDFAFEPI